MMKIRTYRHIDEHGTKLLRDENCPGVCVKGSEVPEVCTYYELKSVGAGMVERCSRDEICDT